MTILPNPKHEAVAQAFIADPERIAEMASELHHFIRATDAAHAAPLVD